jgi:Holliday junction resolvase RusA-like endonuclease
MKLPEYGGLICRIAIPFPPTTNNLFANGQSGRYKTEGYKKWQKDCMAVLLAQKLPWEPIGRPVMAVVWLNRPDKRRRDCANYEKAAIDQMVKANVLSDDCIIVDNRQLWHEGEDCFVEFYETKA